MDKKEGIGLPSSLINEAIGSMDTNVEDSQKAVNVPNNIPNLDINDRDSVDLESNQIEGVMLIELVL